MKINGEIRIITRFGVSLFFYLYRCFFSWQYIIICDSVVAEKQKESFYIQYIRHGVS